MRIRYLATEKKVYEADFACATCGYKAKVQVLGVGVGSASEGLLENGGAASDAVIEARASIGRDAWRSLELVRCRRCGTRGKGIKAWTVEAWVKSGAIGLGGSWLLSRLFPLEPWVLLPGLLLAPAVYWLFYRPVLRAADERVSFPGRGW